MSATLAPALAVLLVAAAVHPQEAIPAAIHITTQERLETEAWWPTMATSPLHSFAGSEACITCHAAQNSRTATGMHHAAARAREVQPLPAPPMPLHSGPLTYSLTGKAGSLELSVAGGGRKAAQNLDWDFGAGDLARTFLYQLDGRWFQSEVSLYTRISALDITTGFGASTSTSLAGTLGNMLSPAEARTCFGCHTVHAVTSAGLDPLHAEAGIGCEACHGPGRQHIEQVTAKPGEKRNSVDSGAATIFQPGKLSPSDSIDFCGACHRSFADASLSSGPQADRAVVRFQPYRLEESKCWRRTQDERLTCVACHDPHQPLNRNLASYDSNCLQCHASTSGGEAHTAAACPKAQHDCVTCHMPKIELPTMHGTFTDHFIRIAKTGDPLPR